MSGREILFDGKKLDYTQYQMEKFVKMWNDGESLSCISETFTISKLEAALLIIHSGEQGYISERPGGYEGTKEHRWKEKIRIELDVSRMPSHDGPGK